MPSEIGSFYWKNDNFPNLDPMLVMGLKHYHDHTMHAQDAQKKGLVKPEKNM